jgi:hypothetical protein
MAASELPSLETSPEQRVLLKTLTEAVAVSGDEGAVRAIVPP